ncbi:succinyl-diaminopimelate desuccinylase [Pseudonocardia ammonioxydans]|uniref:Succinyl-diaminopimelate desuccinylase n=1 Tax=Pseudonocardia ammonioxydans TaxID=260086 RepID=A0A1I4U1G7_PSUAM|nr:M20/M25/M40 family metallo-hydrolase [Pseudonocardia ammonioxydans]SFM82747.1 succinyl-diaminopimelate desuccinylase [Pseudonocardia ammonioxydans]
MSDSSSGPDPVDLAGRLVALDTCGGGERAAADLLANLLDDGGFAVDVREEQPGRANLVARRGSSAPPTTLTGHLDTVPADPAGWSFDPHAGDVVDGRLRGRGTTDMKAGVAAITAAALRSAPATPLQLVFTFGEETGCDGARTLTGLEPSPLLVVAEPTSNRVLHGHKGVLWLRLVQDGVSAHGSRPDLGRNALVALGRVAAALHDHTWPTSSTHGPATCNPGVFRAGTQPNLVPDHAELELDLRLVPGVDAAAAREQVETIARAAAPGPQPRVEVLVDLPSVATDPADPRATAAARALGHTGPGAGAAYASYFTDASVLAGLLGDPAVLVYGPGDPELAHVTDETCSASNIVECTEALTHL